MVLKSIAIEIGTIITGRLWYSNAYSFSLVPLKSIAVKKSVVLKLEKMKLSATPEVMKWYSNA